MRNHAAAVTFIVLVTAACGEKGFDYGPYRIKIQDLVKRADKAPCDAILTKELVIALTEAGDFGGAALRAKTFRGACKPDQPLAEKELDAARRGQNKAQTIEAAQVLVDLSPSFGKRHTELAKAIDDGGDPQQAVLAWRRAFALAPADPGVADGLANAQEKVGQHCEALLSWRRFAAFHSSKEAEATKKIEALATKQGCAQPTPSGAAKLEQKSVGGWYVFPVKLAGQDAELGVDFSAGHTIISRALATKVGAKTEGAMELTAKGVAGTITGHLVTIPSIEIGTIKLAPVEAIVVDKLPNDVQGMMGADVTSRIEMARVADTTWTFAAR